jgi:hypothetical protein
VYDNKLIKEGMSYKKYYSPGWKEGSIYYFDDYENIDDYDIAEIKEMNIKHSRHFVKDRTKWKISKNQDRVKRRKNRITYLESPRC